MARKKPKKALKLKKGPIWGADIKVKLIYLILILVLLLLAYFISSGVYNQLEAHSITKTWP